MENEDSSNATGPSSDSSVYSSPAGVFTGIVSLLSVFLGAVGNSITILILCKTRKIRENTTTWFVTSLAISDLIFSAFALPFLALTILYGDWIFGETLCRIAPCILFCTLSTSLVSMVAITVNRYVLIVHYDWYARIYTRRNIIAMISLGWLLICGVWFLPVLGLWGKFGWSEERRMCTLLPDEYGKSPKSVMALATVLIPSVVAVLCYASIFIEVRRSRLKLIRARRHELTTKGQAGYVAGTLGITKEDIQLIKMVLLTFLVYVGSFLPVVVVRLMHAEVTHPSVAILATAPVSCTCWTNLVIYVWCNQEYREAYRRFLYCRGQRAAAAAAAAEATSIQRL